MTLSTTTHLNFRGNARAALAFYKSVFGGTEIAVSYRDLGASRNPDEADQIVWGQVESPDGFRVMAFDVLLSRPYDPGENAFFVSVRGQDAGEITSYWEKLLVEGTIVQPIGPSGWSPLYGMVKDRFGVTWILDVAAAAG